MQIWSQFCISRDYTFSGALIPYHAYAKKLSLCLLRMLRLGPPLMNRKMKLAFKGKRIYRSWTLEFIISEL